MKLAFVACLCLTVVLGTASQDNRVIVSFGDSWADMCSDAFQHQFALNHDKTWMVLNYGWGGTTANYYAAHPQKIRDALEETEASIVLLSAGGNDFAHWFATVDDIDLATVLKYAKRDVRKILDAIFELQPDVQVLMYGYDFPGSMQDLNLPCPPVIRDLYSTLGLNIVNGVLLSFCEALGDFAVEYTNKNHSMRYVPVIGTLQHLANVPNPPNVIYPSPPQHLRDCIHPSEDGFERLMKIVYDEYFG